jgi:sulfide dehydrogenase [flavocytochrome c] flavoprotein chain
MSSFSRREFIKLIGAGGAASLLGTLGCATPRGAAQAAPRVVVVGGGFGGATCAKYLRRYDPSVHVTLIEQNSQYVTCPASNWVLGGLRTMDDITHGFGSLRDKYGVEVVHQTVTGVDPVNRTVTLQDGQVLGYDRLVLSPGIDFRWDAIPGYDQAASEVMPHAWKAGPQTVALRRQLEAMPDGGTVLICPPAMPFRCPPGPPERASMIAHYLKQHKPRSKILILDAKENFSKQRLFMDGWNELYPGMIEWVAGSAGGKIDRVDARTRTVYTEDGFTSHKGDVVNIIPPQRAAAIAVAAGLVNDGGWCPVDQQTFESLRQPGIHVIGDSAVAGAMPKSGHTANNIAKMTAAAIVADFRGIEVPTPSHVNTCYSLVGPEYAVSIAAVYRLEDGALKGVEGAGGLSPVEGTPTLRRQEAHFASGWYANITADSFS